MLARNAKGESLSVFAAEEDYFGFGRAGENQALGTFFVENRKISGLLMLDEHALGGDVVIERAVAIEVVRGDHRHHRDVRRPVHLLQIFQHEAGDF